jgi:hypothetical protein
VRPAILCPHPGQRVERRVVRGPTKFIPASNEWVHEFEWHGSNKAVGAARKMVKGALRLTKIRTLPDQVRRGTVRQRGREAERQRDRETDESEDGRCGRTCIAV